MATATSSIPFSIGSGGSSLSRPKTIAIALETTGPGGAETMVLGLATALTDRGHRTVLIGPSGGEGWLRDQAAASGLPWRSLDVRGPSDVSAVSRLARILVDEGVEVLHSHEFTMAVFGAAASGLTGVRHVITMHGGEYFAGTARRRVLTRAALTVSHASVTVSHTSRTRLAGLLSMSADRIGVVYNGLSPQPGERSRTRDSLGVSAECVMLAVGNLYPVKGHGVLLEAMARMRSSAPARLWVAGRGAELQALEQRASELGLAERVSFLGFRSDVADLLAAADIFVMPSLSEGLPMAVIEAMFASRPIVASAVGGIPELVRDGVTGLLVPPEDPDALAAALDRVASDPELRGSLGEAAARVADARLSKETMATRYSELYSG